ncbi:hypothetical protein [Demequina maris]|uniref:hypothetical protein n=1 Tax=Demequina maris TaxID=1638982 RepID=UPI000781A42C|nr:hypothetical protein [Demequina maris]
MAASIDDALTAILARSEPRIAGAAARAVYEAFAAVQGDDATDADRLAVLHAFATARERLEGDLADLRLLA